MTSLYTLDDNDDDIFDTYYEEYLAHNVISENALACGIFDTVNTIHDVEKYYKRYPSLPWEHYVYCNPLISEFFTSASLDVQNALLERIAQAPDKQTMILQNYIKHAPKLLHIYLVEYNDNHEMLLDGTLYRIQLYRLDGHDSLDHLLLYSYITYKYQNVEWRGEACDSDTQKIYHMRCEQAKMLDWNISPRQFDTSHTFVDVPLHI